MYYKTSISPFAHSANSVAMVMRRVLYAFIPGIALYVWFFGWGIIISLLLASVTALVCEMMVLWLRSKPILPFLTDGTALITAWSLSLAIPPLVPWWIPVIGTAFAIIFVKHLYGGLGYNPFNPSMAAFVLLLISFPVEMTHWPALSTLMENGHYPTFMDSVSIAFTGHLPGGLPIDALSGATPLDVMKTGVGQSFSVAEVKTHLAAGYTQSLFGYASGQGWEWIAMGFLIGGIWMLLWRVISWHIPVAVLGSLVLISGLFYLINPQIYPSPWFHLLSGASILCAFFIASDPITGATSVKGRFIFGAGIGILIYVIRTWGGYPDGVAFAVLLMNIAVPTIDYYTQPRVFGH